MSNPPFNPKAADEANATLQILIASEMIKILEERCMLLTMVPADGPGIILTMLGNWYGRLSKDNAPAEKCWETVSGIDAKNVFLTAFKSGQKTKD